MGFIIQLKCKSCGYRTPSDDEPHYLIDPMGMQELAPCVCNDCHKIFQREFITQEDKAVPGNKCVFCCSEDIDVKSEITNCPQCGSDELELECLGTFF